MNFNCFLLNYPAHYRKLIYKRISEEVNADFYFGDIPNSTIKKLDFKDLDSYKKTFKTIAYKNIFWYLGALELLFKPYKNYVLIGDPQILSNWPFLILAKILGKRTFLWTHGYYGRESFLKKIIKKTYFKLATKVLLYGNYSRNLMIEDGFSPEKLVVIYNSLDYDAQVKIKQNLKKENIYPEHFGNKNSNLFYIGRIQESKKIEQILDAMIILEKKDINTNLTIIGGEDPTFDFRKEIENRNLEKNVWIVGASYDEEKNAKLIYNADVCVSPGNVGLTALHSLTYDKPVITHNDFKNQMPEFETIVEGKSGAFFDKDNIQDLADKIELVLKSNYQHCSEIIDKVWNPHNKVKILKQTLTNY